MCRKLVFLTSLVLLLSWGAIASAVDLTVPAGTTYTVTAATEDYETVEVEGTLVVPAGKTLTMSNRDSYVDGAAATILVDGGAVICNCRFNIGTGSNGTIIIQNGGSFTQQCPGEDCNDGIKFPDDEGGEHRIFVLDGTLDANSIEQQSDRDAKFSVGCNGTITVGYINTGDNPERYDPDE